MTTYVSWWGIIITVIATAIVLGLVLWIISEYQNDKLQKELEEILNE